MKPHIYTIKNRVSGLIEDLQQMQLDLSEWETEDLHVSPPARDPTVKAEITKALVELLNEIGGMTDSIIGYHIHRDVCTGPIRYKGPTKLFIEIVYNELELKRRREVGRIR